jgi:hypothetical protein
MKHASSRTVFDYWNQQRGDRLVPDRADIDPAAIRHALGDVFMLAVDFVDEYRFRLAGTRVCALFGRELKGESFNALWDGESRSSIQSLLTVAAEEELGAVTGVTGQTETGDVIELELLLLPLAHRGHARIRTLGVLAPAETPYWLGQTPVQALTVGPIRHVGPAVDRFVGRRFVAAAKSRLKSRVRRAFMVYQGGRGTPPNEKAG